MFSFIRTHCKLCALIFTIVNWFVWVGFYPSLQNDDFQISFLLQGGGEGSSSFNLFTNIALSCILAQLQNVSSSTVWYLLALFLVSLASAYSINFLFADSMDEGATKTSFGILKSVISICILIFINRAILTSIQFTHVGIIACCAGALLISRMASKGGSRTMVLSALTLILSGFCIRDQSIIAFIFIMLGTGCAYLVGDDRSSSVRPVLITLAVLLPSLVGLHFLNSVLYHQSTEWGPAQLYSKARYNIQDYPDNSKIDKRNLLTAKGIKPTEYTAFKSFLYVPSMDSLSKVKDLSEIHQQGREGLFGSKFAADHLLLKPTAKQFKEPFSSLMTITPWGTLGVAFFLFIISINRQSIRRNGPVLLAFGAYMACLLILGRSPGRVVHPMVITTAFWVLIHLPNEAPLLRKRWMAWGSWGVCALGVAFCFRHSFHWRPSSPRAEAHEYCAARPENLYITTNQQGCGLFPVGFTGYSMDYLHKTNVLPVGDGWMFYTPAYRAALAARKIENPYRELLKDNVYVITFRQEDKWVLKQLSALHELYTGQGVEFSKVHAIGEHSFWKAHQLPNAAK